VGVRTLVLVGVLLVFATAAQAAAPKLKPGDRRAIDVTLREFVRTAVQRRDLAASYDLVTPALRTGISRRAWAHGTTRVMAYPARNPRPYGWTLDFAEPRYVMVDLLLQPRRGARAGPMIFTVELRQRRGRWLVHSFTPSASFSGAGWTGSMKAFGDYGPNAVKNAKPRHVNRLLLVVPAVVLLLIVAVPTGIVVRGWRRNRRAEQAYGRVQKSLPPLPPRP
jgi:hypothetical protein